MKRLLPIAIALFLPLCTAAEDRVLDLTLTMANGAVTAAATGFARNDLIDVPNQNVVLNVHCVAFACEGITVMLGSSTQFTPARGTDSSNNPMLTVTVQANQITSGGQRLRVMNGTNEIFSVSLRNVGTGSTGGGSTATTDPNADPCWDVTLTGLGVLDVPGAHFLITPGGSIQDRTTDPIDEDDPVFIHVISSEENVLKSIEVTRTSATRTTGNISIIGGNVTGLTLNRQAAGPCLHRTYELGDFAWGEAVVDISARQQAQRASLGTLRFTVNRLWDGILSAGPVWSPLTDRAYGLAPRTGHGNVIIETQNGGDDIFYAAQYTYFIRGRRDVEKPKPPLSQRINPTLGLSLNDPADHALIGVSVDSGQFVFSAGLHAANVARLADGAGAAVGQTFTGTAAEIPVEKKWRTGFYFAITVDARVVNTLINSITAR